MSRKYIEFISAYCDRWCERCAFTERCSSYAVHAAIAMCDGDYKAALELAVGPPANRSGPAAPHEIPEEFLAEPTPQEMEDFRRREEAADERIEESPLTTAAMAVSMLAWRWLNEHLDPLRARGDAAITDAADTASWDAHFIAAKLHRALHGRDGAQHGDTLGDDYPVQNDWNGSAKVALISIERSGRAWGVLAEATGDPDASELVEKLTALQAAVEVEFPNARQFVRPGFDDDGRRRRFRLFGG